jgi:hypothetical protein
MAAGPPHGSATASFVMGHRTFGNGSSLLARLLAVLGGALSEIRVGGKVAEEPQEQQDRDWHAEEEAG